MAHEALINDSVTLGDCRTWLEPGLALDQSVLDYSQYEAIDEFFLVYLQAILDAFARLLLHPYSPFSADYAASISWGSLAGRPSRRAAIVLRRSPILASPSPNSLSPKRTP
jgi:hypothetical protein